MTISRRHFVHYSAGTAGLAALSPRHARTTEQHVPPGDPARHALLAARANATAMRALASRAVDAARDAGAVYADARLTRTVAQSFIHQSASNADASTSDDETLGIGVRALFNGYWGFAASPYWDADEAVRLAHDAVAQARVNSRGGTRHADLGTIPIAKGDWTTPGIDPFTIPIEEKIDLMNGWRQSVSDMTPRGLVVELGTASMEFIRQEGVMVSTEGTSIAQTLYRTSGGFPITVRHAGWRAAASGEGAGAGAKGLEPQRKGWEQMLDANIRDQIPGMIESAAAMLTVPVRVIDVGRYDLVMDAGTVGNLIASTIGTATQLDRALGYEANAGGTSYLGPNPLELLGTFQVGAPSLTITADRTAPGAAATVAWDDDGVVPTPFTLVQHGMLADYQTTREQAAWLAPYYQKQGRAITSNACARGQTALYLPIQQPPNLTMAPGAAPVSTESLIADTRRGLAVTGGGVSIDFQARGGAGFGMFREINNGKLGAICTNAAYIFSTTELLKNMVAIGGADSVVRGTASNFKGQPYQGALYSVSAVPAKFTNANVIDTSRHA